LAKQPQTQDVKKFSVKLDSSDWNKEIRAWNCLALGIPGAKVDGIYTNGSRIDPDHYKLDPHASHILYLRETVPESIYVSLVLEYLLDRKSKTNRYKFLSIVLPLMSAIIVA
jgi:hypothetical protein